MGVLGIAADGTQLVGKTPENIAVVNPEGALESSPQSTTSSGKAVETRADESGAVVGAADAVLWAILLELRLLNGQMRDLRNSEEALEALRADEASALLEMAP